MPLSTYHSFIQQEGTEQPAIYCTARLCASYFHVLFHLTHNPISLGGGQFVYSPPQETEIVSGARDYILNLNFASNYLCDIAQIS